MDFKFGKHNDMFERMIGTPQQRHNQALQKTANPQFGARVVQETVEKQKKDTAAEQTLKVSADLELVGHTAVEEELEDLRKAVLTEIEDFTILSRWAGEIPEYIIEAEAIERVKQKIPTPQELQPTFK
jgi:hypothetical protein